MHKSLYYAQLINTNADIMKSQCQNHSWTGKIYNKIPKTKHTQGLYCVKFTNVSPRTQIYLPLPMAQPPYYIQWIHRTINF